ncbi:MAG: outer membrane lipoprotein-sorting protein [Candidatus Margulisiibacteriota bacterium]
MKRIIIVLVLLQGLVLAAPLLPAEKLPSQMTARLRYQSGGEKRVVDLVVFNNGADRSLLTLESPAEKGAKYLRIGASLWLFSADADRPIKLTGHILASSFLGSAFSYADLMTERNLSDYSVEVVTSEPVVINFPKGTGEAAAVYKCQVLLLKAKTRQASYFKRQLWVDQALKMIVKEKMISVSGRVIKTIEYGDFRKFKRDTYPAYLRARGGSASGAYSELFVSVAEFDKELSPLLFNP